MKTKAEKMSKETSDWWTNFAIGGDTTLDVSACQQAFARLYALRGLDAPKVFVYDSGLAAIRAVRETVPDASFDVLDTGGLQHWAGECAQYEFMFALGRCKSDALLEVKRAVCLAGVWGYLPCGDAVYVHRRPSVCHQDRQKRLHCKTGPAIEFVDGFDIWSWHGQSISTRWFARLPEHFLTEDLLTAIEALKPYYLARKSGLTCKK